MTKTELLPRLLLEEARILRLEQPGARLSLATALAAREPGRPLLCGHVGRSMNPTLDPVDLLEVLPYEARAPRAGDVVLFQRPDGECLVVHRIMRIAGGRISTRGDNNAEDDDYTLVAGDLVGRVVAAQRGARRRRIAGGRQGLSVAGRARWLRSTRWRLFRGLRPIYASLARSGLIGSLLPPSLHPRVVVFRSGGERSLRLLWGRHVIGHFDPQTAQWRIPRPFRLLVDERSLPRHPNAPALPRRAACKATADAPIAMP